MSEVEILSNIKDPKIFLSVVRLFTTARIVRNFLVEILKWITVVVAVVLPPVYLAFRPQDYTPAVQVMFSIFLALIAFWIGKNTESQKAKREASDRWLPQAEAVTYRLLTLHINVCKFSATTKRSCGATACDLPELEREDMRAVRIKIRGDCTASSERLDDIARQLEDAIEDWRRFIVANCYGEECQRIFDAIEQRKSSLAKELSFEVSPNG